MSILAILLYFVLAWILITKSTNYMKKQLGTDQLTWKQEVFCYFAAAGILGAAMIVSHMVVGGLTFLFLS